jgi:2-oxoglutarate dehydrogenase E2 component (dihydrolipoamide succinyltransferase)
MPQLGESVTEGTVTRWLKKEGERVEVDEPLLEVSTDKVDTEIPSPASGILRGIAVDEDETVAVGAQLAVIEDNEGATAGAPAPQASPPAAQTQQAQPPQQTQQPPQQPAAPASSDGWRSPQPNYAPPAPPTAAPAPAQAPAPVGQAPGYAPPPSYGQQPPQPRSAPEPRETPQEQRDEDHQPSAGDAPYVTPLVRKLAAEHAVDLESITGTGVGGRIRKQDVIEAARVQREQAQAAQQAAAPQSAAASQQPAAAAPQSAPSAGQPARQAVAASPLRGTTQRMSRPRQVIAQRMVESLQTSAQLTTVVEADVTAIARLRDRAKRDFEAREGVKLSFLPFFALATVEALKVHPKLNAVIDGDQVTYHDAEHLGIAVDTERGLMVPVIHSAGDLNIGGLARKIADLAQRTRSGQVSPDELSSGTFTLTNTGSRGALFDTPIINQPQVAILGTGTVVKRAVVVEDASLGEVIAVRSMVYLALTYDHRLVDGADAARFLTTVAARLEEGAFEAELGL